MEDEQTVSEAVLEEATKPDSDVEGAVAPDAETVVEESAPDDGVLDLNFGPDADESADDSDATNDAPTLAPLKALLDVGDVDGAKARLEAHEQGIVKLHGKYVGAVQNLAGIDNMFAEVGKGNAEAMELLENQVKQAYGYSLIELITGQAEPADDDDLFGEPRVNSRLEARLKALESELSKSKSESANAVKRAEWLSRHGSQAQAEINGKSGFSLTPETIYDMVAKGLLPKNPTVTDVNVAYAKYDPAAYVAAVSAKPNQTKAAPGAVLTKAQAGARTWTVEEARADPVGYRNFQRETGR